MLSPLWGATTSDNRRQHVVTLFCPEITCYRPVLGGRQHVVTGVCHEITPDLLSPCCRLLLPGDNKPPKTYTNTKKHKKCCSSASFFVWATTRRQQGDNKATTAWVVFWVLAGGGLGSWGATWLEGVSCMVSVRLYCLCARKGGYS